MAKNTGHGSRQAATDSAAGGSATTGGWMKRNVVTGAFTQSARDADKAREGKAVRAR